MEIKQRPTIYDIAEKANVSISTVSRVFNNSELVTSKTRNKVENAIRELNYIPNAIARSLVNQKSKTIALIVSDISNPFFTRVIEGVEDVVSKAGYFILYCDTRYDLKREENYIQQLLEQRVDGIITFSTSESAYKIVKNVEKVVPFVSIQSELKGADSINTYDVKGAFLAVEHLISLGHENIALIIYDYNNLSINSRINGYIHAHKHYKLPVKKEYIFKTKFLPNAGYHETNEVLDSHPEITAIFAYNDILAASCYSALENRGLKIPEDVSVVGFDNTNISSIIAPKLTTVAQPMYEIGANAAQLLMQKLNGGEQGKDPQMMILPTKLIVRDSTSKAKKFKEST